MGLRIKILSGFLILAAMLLVAGTWSIYELRNIGQSVQHILDDNYHSVNAAKCMTESLERQGSAVLLLMLGKREEGRTILQSAHESFSQALVAAHNNITLPGEQSCIDAIGKAYGEYRALWSQSIVGTGREGDLNWYLSEVHASFLAVKLAVASLMDLNDNAMYTTAYNLEARAHRATMPGIIAIASAFIFSLLFSFLINLYVVTPIISVTQGIRNYLESGKPLNVKVETSDELGRLVSSIQNLISRFQALRDRQ